MNNKVELRPYQKSQYDFINRKISGKLPIAIESPTGSGKSFVILEFARKQLELAEDTNQTIVITTGFNNLVYQIEKDAREYFGLNPIVLVGKGHRVCGRKLMEREGLTSYPNIRDGWSAFSSEKELHCDSSCGPECESNSSLYNQARSAARGFGPKIIITNHSSYLIGLKYNWFNPDITIVDESHTFSTFYDSFLKVEIKKQEIDYIKSILDDRDPTLMLFSRALESNVQISPQIFNQIKKKLEAKKNRRFYDLGSRLLEFSRVKPSLHEYVDISKKGMEITKFWSNYDVHQESIQYVLFSATQDTFTRNMFGVTKARFYREKECNTIDYRDSEFLIIPEEEFKVGVESFLDYVGEKGLKKGLILSTTNKDVRYMKSLKETHGYKIYTSLNKFTKATEKSILVGSRALFQGIDVPDIEFVALNRIPFARYDGKYRARQRYLKDIARMNTWYEFTLPEVYNTITQATGRLWRSPGDKGVVAVLDPRLVNGKFDYMVKPILEIRPGIKLNVFESEIEQKFEIVEDLDGEVEIEE